MSMNLIPDLYLRLQPLNPLNILVQSESTQERKGDNLKNHKQNKKQNKYIFSPELYKADINRALNPLRP